jgi:hypothetical protein
MQPSEVTGSLIQQFSDVPKLYQSSAEFDFGWWYQYFWKEAKSQATTKQASLKQLICDVVDAVKDHGLGSGIIVPNRNPAEIITGALTKPLPAPRSYRGKKILKLLLDMGFRAMPIATPGQSLGPSGKRTFELQIQVSSSGRSVPLTFGFRGVTTKFEKILEYRGALNRVDLRNEDSMRNLNMWQAWHPFSDSKVAEKMYYRLGSNDNCLYSVVSAADTPRLAVGFPLIEDEQIYRLPKKSLDQWDASDLQAAKNGPNPVVLVKAACTVDGERKTGLFLATETYFYVFKVTGDAVHTEDFLMEIDRKMGGQCQERGVRKVPLSDFLVGVRVRRVHLGPQRTDGIIGFIQDVRFMQGGAWQQESGLNEDTFIQEHFFGDNVSATPFLTDMKNKYRIGATIVGERDAGSPATEKPAVVRKLKIPEGLGGLPQANPALNVPIKINRTGQTGRFGTTEFRAASSHKRIDINSITQWDVPATELTQFRTATDAFYGRSV